MESAARIEDQEPAMNITKNLGMLLLSIWLIAQGATALLAISFPALPMVMAGLAIAAGVCILIGR